MQQYYGRTKSWQNLNVFKTAYPELSFYTFHHILYFRRMQPNSNGTTDFQHTLASEISISGVGIHTGQMVDMVLKPAAPNTGIVFQRVDLPGKPIVKADVDNVVDTTRSTTIEANGASAHQHHRAPDGRPGRQRGR